MRFPEAYRVQRPFPSHPGSPWGCFLIPGRAACGRPLYVIANSGDTDPDISGGWDHLSVTLHHKAKITPSWQEMSVLKSLFWEDETPVVQYHPPAEEHVSYHDGCLHLWHHPEHLTPDRRPPMRLVGGPQKKPAPPPHQWPSF